VQGNIVQSIKYDPKFSRDAHHTIATSGLSRQVTRAAAALRIVIWPEASTVLPF
jgi:apolipoprotein N-acyltransferase